MNDIKAVWTLSQLEATVVCVPALLYPLLLLHSQPLASLLKEMLIEVREGAVKKREELENLSQEEVKIDLVSHKT